MDQSSAATITAQATVALAAVSAVALLASVLVAGFTAWAARSAARAAKVAEDSLEEVRWERELDVAPYLAFDLRLDRDHPGDPDWAFAEIHNLGRGPALGSIVISVDSRHLGRQWSPVDVGANKKATQGMSFSMQGIIPIELYAGLDRENAAGGGHVAYCTSIGRTATYRFRLGFPADEPWRSGQDPPYWAAALRQFAPELTPVPRPQLAPKASAPRQWSRVWRRSGSQEAVKGRVAEKPVERPDEE